MLAHLQSYFEETAYLKSYEKNLAPLHDKNTVLAFSTKIKKFDIEQEFNKEMQENTKARGKQSLRSFMLNIPDQLNCHYSFRKDNPRVSYLIVDNLPDMEGDHYGEYELYVHPISILTINNWIFINKFVHTQLEEHQIPYFINETNVVSARQVHRFGKNFLYFTGDWDLKWLAKPINKRRFFSTSEDYVRFYLRESGILRRERKLTYTDLYEEAKKLAYIAISNHDKINIDGKYKILDSTLNDEDFKKLVDYYFVKLKKENTNTQV